MTSTSPKAKPTSGAMMSKVGNPQVYEDGDQRHAAGGGHHPSHTQAKPEHMHEHNIFDRKDSRTLRAREEQELKEEHEAEEAERHKMVTNPLEPALRHGHKPSRGAQVDARLQHEDEEALQAKGPYFGMSHNATKHRHEHEQD